MAERGKFGAYSGILSAPVSKTIETTWVGDQVNDRVIDLLDDYTFLVVFLEESRNENDEHLALAYALSSCYGLFIERAGGTIDVQHDAMGGADNRWQGKMTGPDATKIKLGAVGNQTGGMNELNLNYRLAGLKLE